MRKIHTFLLAVFALGVVAAAFGTPANAQGMKMGWVDDERIRREYKAWARAQEQWDIEQKAWEDEAVEREQELREMLDEYDKQKLILSEEKRKEREAQIRVKREALDNYTKQVYGPGGTAESKHAELIQPILQTVNEAIRLLAEEENYDVIFTLQSNLAYIKEEYEVTDKVLEYLDRVEQ